MPPVDLNEVDTKVKPDPAYKPDPKLRGDMLSSTVTDELEEEEIELEEEPDKKEPTKKEPTKKEPTKKELVKKDPDEEEEEPEEEESESEEEEESEDEPAGKGKGNSNARIRKVIADKKAALERLEAIEKENASLRSQQSKEEKKEFDELQDKLNKLYEQVEEQRALGEYKEAAKLQRQLDELRGSMSRAETVLLSRQAALAQQEVHVFNAALAQVETVFPELGSEHPDFDQDTLQALDETIKGYEANGDSPSEALRKACRRLLKYDPFAKGDAAFLPGNIHAPGKKTKAKEEPPKKTTDIKRNLDAASKQPLDPADDNSDVETAIDPKKVKPEDWGKLPESVRRKLRGDTR